jgi:hypothetical protein
MAGNVRWCISCERWPATGHKGTGAHHHPSSPENFSMNYITSHPCVCCCLIMAPSLVHDRGSGVTDFCTRQRFLGSTLETITSLNSSIPHHGGCSTTVMSDWEAVTFQTSYGPLYVLRQSPIRMACPTVKVQYTAGPIPWWTLNTEGLHSTGQISGLVRKMGMYPKWTR